MLLAAGTDVQKNLSARQQYLLWSNCLLRLSFFTCKDEYSLDHYLYYRLGEVWLVILYIKKGMGVGERRIKLMANIKLCFEEV